MCRLLGYAAASPTTLRALVGDSALAQFTSLARVHADGWGTAWVGPGGQGLESVTSTSSAITDPAFAATAEDAQATARTVHLRWATVGYPVNRANTHPFRADDLAFAHNGRIAPTDALDALLTSQSRAGLRGTTDSERYFALLRQELGGAGGDPAEAARRAVRTLRVSYPTNSLNALLLTPTTLVVIHVSSAGGVPTRDFSTVPGGAPLDHENSYFLMRWRRAGDGSVLFASSGMDATGWTPLPPESITAVDLVTLGVRQLPIDKSWSIDQAQSSDLVA